MKKNALLVVVMLVVSLAYAQKKDPGNIPAVVFTTFRDLYPAADKIKWEEEDGNFEVSFVLQGSNYSVVLNGDGNVLETEVGIIQESLPETIRKYVAQQHPGLNIKEAATITDAQGLIRYEIELKGKELHFDKDGHFLGEMKKHDD